MQVATQVVIKEKTMAATHTPRKLLNLPQKGAIAFITVIAAVVLLFMNVVVSPAAMVLGTIVDSKSSLSLPLTIFGGSSPGMLIAYLIYRLFTSNRFKSLGLSFLVIIPTICFWFFFAAAHSSSVVGNWMAAINIMALIVALTFIKIKIKKTLFNTQEVKL